jgi:AraC-like DNA-binding protein
MNRHWSTSDVPVREQFGYWREAVCEAVMNVATEEAPNTDFFGKITCTDHGDLRFASFSSTPHRIVRRTSHIGRSNSAHYLISLQRTGVGQMHQANQHCELRAGDIGFVDGERPFSVTFPEAVDRAVAVVPSVLLYSRAPWLRDRPVGRMAHDPDLHPMLRLTMKRLSGPACKSINEAELLTDNLCNLVVLLTAPDNKQRRTAEESISNIDRMLAFVRRRFSDPHLSPQMLADYLQISVRTVHKRFEVTDTSFGRALLEMRLEAAHRILSDPQYSALTVTQIAFGVGFNDLSHFTKRFRAKFGASPTHCRTHHSSVIVQA